MKEVIIHPSGRLDGTRITVYDILDYARHGRHHTYIAAALGISSAEVLAGLRFIEEHKDEVMAEYQKMLDRDAQGNPPEAEAKWAESHAKLLARLAERRRTQGEEANSASDPAGH